MSIDERVHEERVDERVHEEQIYEVQVGKVDMLVRAYQDEGLAILRRALGRDALVGLWTVELGGSMDEMIQIWEFSSETERRKRRTSLWRDPEWVDFAARFGPLIVRRSMRSLTPINS